MFNLAIDSKLRLRPRGAPCGRRGTQRLRGRQSNYPPEQNGSARPLRADRGHTPGAGRLPAGERTESGTILVPWPACPGSVTHDAPIGSAGFPLDRRHRLGPNQVRDLFQELLTSALAAHSQVAAVPVTVFEPQRNDLVSTKPKTRQEQQHCAIAQTDTRTEIATVDRALRAFG